MCDIVARVVKHEDDSRTIEFKSDEYIFGGCRLRDIQETVIPLDWSELCRVYDIAQGKVTTKHEEKTTEPEQVEQEQEEKETPKRRTRKARKAEPEPETVEEPPFEESEPVEEEKPKRRTRKRRVKETEGE